MMNIELNLKLSVVFMMYKNDLQATHSTISVTCEVWRSIDRVRQAFAAANHQPADSVHGDASNQTLILTHLRNFATIWSYRMLKWFFKTAIINKHMILFKMVFSWIPRIPASSQIHTFPYLALLHSDISFLSFFWELVSQC